MENNKINYAETIKTALTDHELDFTCSSTEDGYIFNYILPGSNIPGYSWMLRVRKNGSAKFWCYIAKNVPVSKHGNFFEIFNKLHDSYRFLRFSLDSDSDISADYDMILFGDEEAASDQIITATVMLNEILDKSYPAIMKCLWSEQESDSVHTDKRSGLFDEDEDNGTPFFELPERFFTNGDEYDTETDSDSHPNENDEIAHEIQNRLNELFSSLGSSECEEDEDDEHDNENDDNEIPVNNGSETDEETGIF